MVTHKQFAVYILTNSHKTVLYTGVTNDLVRRVYEHKQRLHEGFTQKYNVTKLVYYELIEEPLEAIKREKQVKNLVRRKKTALINLTNPEWKDLYYDLLI